ncbi:hypothetical protein PZ78_13280 [Vreelandella venusta]|nr:hypothetical protein PZ78_13280 [Halomonas hydrothermalis]
MLAINNNSRNLIFIPSQFYWHIIKEFLFIFSSRVRNTNPIYVQSIIFATYISITRPFAFLWD